MSKLTIDLDDIVKLSSDGKGFVFNPDAEESILKLLELRNNVDKAITDIKKEIATQGVKINPGFSGVRGSKIQASYRHYGQTYKIVDPTKANLFVTKSVTYRPIATAIEDHVDQYGKLPDGIVVNEREKVISLKPL